MTTPVTWTPVVDYRDIRYEHSGTGIAKVTINRPEVRNAFRPQTVRELIDAFARIRDDASIGCVLLTGEGDKAFCSGGDQNYKSHGGGYLDTDGLARLNVLDLQRQIRSLPIPVIALVNGYAIGGGHVLHIVCDMSIASENAIFGQVGPQVGSFDAGFGVGSAGAAGGRQEGEGDLVPVPPVLGGRGARDAPREQGRAARGPRGRGRAVGERDPGHEPDGDPLPQVGVPRRDRRPGRAPGVRRQRDGPLLHDRRGARGLHRRSSRSARPTTASSRGGPDDALGPRARPPVDAASAIWIWLARPAARRCRRRSRGVAVGLGAGARGRGAVPARTPRSGCVAGRAAAPGRRQLRQRPAPTSAGAPTRRTARGPSGSPRPGS